MLSLCYLTKIQSSGFIMIWSFQSFVLNGLICAGNCDVGFGLLRIIFCERGCFVYYHVGFICTLFEWWYVFLINYNTCFAPLWFALVKFGLLSHTSFISSLFCLPWCLLCHFKIVTIKFITTTLSLQIGKKNYMCWLKNFTKIISF